MKGMLIAIIGILSVFLLFSVILLICIAWTHHPEGIIKANRKNRKERKQREKNC